MLININYVLISIMFTIISCNHQSLPSPKVHYSFSGNTADGKYHSKNLENCGADPSPDRFGASNSAYYFDGNSASMSVNLSNMPNIGGSLTISWWYRLKGTPVYKDSLDAGNMIALVDTTKAIGLQFGYRAPGYKTKGMDVWNWGGETILECQTPKLQQWHHCVYTYDGYVHKYFLNGQLISESEVKPQSGRPNYLMLGNYPSGRQYYAGSLDEIRIYDHALTIREVAELFNSEHARPSN